MKATAATLDMAAPMPRMTASEIKGHMAALSANVIFGLNIPVTKALLGGWMTPMGYTLTRMLFGLVMFWSLGLFQSKEKVSFRYLLMMLAGGFLGLVATQMTFALALKYTTPTLYALLMALTPMVVLLLSVVFLKEQITSKKIIGVLLGISGAVLIVLQSGGGASGNQNFLGILMAVLSATSYAAYIITMRKTAEKHTPVTVMKWKFLFATLILLPFGLPELPTQPIYSTAPTWTPVLLLGFALLFSSLLGFFLMPVGLKRLRASTAGVYANLQPIVAATVAIAVGQDAFSWTKPVALLLVIGGVYFVTQNKR
jgi:drug/metabolite transporter (DMT)-like permease